MGYASWIETWPSTLFFSDCSLLPKPLNNEIFYEISDDLYKFLNIIAEWQIFGDWLPLFCRSFKHPCFSRCSSWNSCTSGSLKHVEESNRLKQYDILWSIEHDNQPESVICINNPKQGYNSWQRLMVKGV